MKSPVREFLTLEQQPVAEMDIDALANEVEGWRMVMNMLPRDVMEWLARHHEVMRFIFRNYQGHIGLLLGVKFEPVEYLVATVEQGFDSLRGKQTVETKTMTIQASSVLLYESIEETHDKDLVTDEADLADMSLELTA